MNKSLTLRIRSHRYWVKKHFNRIHEDKQHETTHDTLEDFVKILDDHPNRREYLDKLIVDICREENISPNQVFFMLYFYYIYGFLSVP